MCIVNVFAGLKFYNDVIFYQKISPEFTNGLTTKPYFNRFFFFERDAVFLKSNRQCIAIDGFKKNELLFPSWSPGGAFGPEVDALNAFFVAGFDGRGP